jgi:PAS domain S-box-containing protein
VASAVAEQRPFTIEYRAVRTDGETIWVRNQTHTVSDREGRFIGYEGTVQDITAQREAETNLALFKSIAESSQIAIAVSDPNGRMIYINPAHTRLFGRTLAEARHTNYREFYPPESVDVLESAVAPALDRGEEWEGILDARDATGRRFPLWERASTVRDSDGKMVCAFGFMQDVTKQVRLKEIAEIAEAERIKLRRELHDTVCQRLAGAGMLADHLREDLAESPEGAQRVDEIARLIRQSLDEAHLIGQQMEPLPDAPGALLKSLEDLAVRITGMYSVRCRVTSRSRVKLQDRAARNQLLFIAQEAATNAVRHADAARIGISLFRRGRAVVLRVQDNGRGMPKQEDKRNGMGIKILHERAELIGAKLSIQQPKKGGTIVECVWKPPEEQEV